MGNVICPACGKSIIPGVGPDEWYHETAEEHAACPLAQQRVELMLHPARGTKKIHPVVSAVQVEDVPDNVVNLDEYRKRKNDKS